MGCIQITKTNLNESYLYNDLLKITGNDEKEAKKLYSYFSSDEVIGTYDELTKTREGGTFGDYINNVEDNIEDNFYKDRVDENGEPKLFYNDALSKFYYLDVYNEPVFYPSTKQGLNQVLQTNEIKTFSKSLALKYYLKNIAYDFNTLIFTNKNLQGLDTLIEEVLNSKIKELKNQENSEQLLKGYALEETLEYKKEWRDEVINFFNGLNILYQVEEDNETDEDENNRGTLKREESFLKSNLNSVNNNVKLFLSLIQSDEVNEFNEYDFVPFVEIFSNLNKALSNIVPVHDKNGQLEDIFELFKDKILELGNVKPYFGQREEQGGPKGLYDLLDSPDISEDFKNKFASSFNLFSKNYLGSTNSSNKLTNEYTILNLSEVGNRKSNILDQWSYNKRFNFLERKEFRALRKELIDYKNQYISEFKKINSEVDLLPSLQNLKKIFNALGVVYTQKGFDLFLNKLDLKGISLEDKKNNLNTVFSNLIRGLDASITSKKLDLFRSQTLFGDIAEAEAFFMKEGSDASIFTVGKTKWSYSLPSFLDLKINMWKKDPTLLAKHYKSSPFNKGSHFMYYLSAQDMPLKDRIEESKKRLDKVKIFVFNSIQNEGDSVNASDNKDISDTDSLVDFIHKQLNHKKGGITYYKTALAADKSTEYQIHYGDNSDFFNIDTGALFIKKDNAIQLNESVVDIFYKYFKSDYKRISIEYYKILEGDDLIQSYHTGPKNSLKSQLFPSLTDNSVITLFGEEGRPLYTDIDQVKDELKLHIKNILSDNIIKTYSELQKNNVFIYGENGEVLNNLIDTSIYEKYIAEVGEKRAFLKLAADLFINSTISQVEYSKMFSGDLAYYKNLVDYKKRVPETYTDGLYMRLTTGEEKFNISVIENVEMSATDLEEMKSYLPKEIWEKYEKNLEKGLSGIDSTDAQAWITPERWEFIMRKLGKWSDELSVVYSKMKSNNPIFTPKELKVLAQPLKGVYFDVIDGRPVYLKYSQAVLLPNLIKNGPLKDLYNKMTRNPDGTKIAFKDQVHEAITLEGIKVGSPVPVSTHSEDGMLKDDFTLNKVALNNAFWKLQQDLPTKGIKPTEVGSQIQKNVFQGLVRNTSEEFIKDNGEVITGTELINTINNIFSAKSSNGVRKLKNKLGLNDAFEIENESILYSTLIKQLEKRGDTPDNLIKALKAGTSPYGIPGAFNIFQNAFSSMVNKETVKIRTNGGGFIQMADYGLSREDAENYRSTDDKSGILFTPWFENKRLHGPKVVTNKDGKKFLSPGGVFLSGSIIAKYIPNYKRLSSEKLFGTLNEETGTYENGIIDERILRNIIGYRIPNQGLPSNDALQVMGILPEEIGDTVIAYTGITTKTGSDYDIDKMYLMVPSFYPKYSKKKIDSALDYIINEDLTYGELALELRELGYDVLQNASLEEVQLAFAEELIRGEELENNYIKDYNEQDIKIPVRKLIYASPKMSQGKQLPLSQQPEEALSNMLIEAYKTVFTNIKVAQDLMNPVDLDYIKEDIKNLYPDEDLQDLDSFSVFKDLKLKTEFRLGKAGLGQNINSLMDSIRGSMGTLGFNNYYLGWGKSNSDKETIFDSEYSESLTKTELKEYLNSFNETAVKKITKEDLKKLSKIKLNEAMMVLVNGFVDIAKDPFIVKGNWVTQTNGLGFMLLRAGVHPFKINAFLSQPILKDFIVFRNNRESKTVNDASSIQSAFKLYKASEFFSNDIKETVTINEVSLSKKTLFDSIFTLKNVLYLGDPKSDNYKKNIKTLEEKITKRLKSKFGKKSNPDEIDALKRELINTLLSVFKPSYVSFEELTLLNMRNQIKKKTTPAFQLKILDTFLGWQQQAKLLSNNVKASRFDVDGKGKNISSLLIANNLVKETVNKENNDKAFIGFSSKLETNGISSILGTAKENGLDFPYKIMTANKKYFLTAHNSVASTFNQVSQFIYGTNLLDQNLGDNLEKSYYSYIMSGFRPFRGSKKSKKKLLEKLPKQFIKIKKKYPNNILLADLRLVVGENSTESYISMSNIKKAPSYKNDLTDSWRDLLENEPKFAEDLIKYSYLITGFNNSVSQFHEFIPYEWFNKNRFNSYLKSLNLSQEIDRTFIDQFFRNNTKNSSVVKNVFDNKMKPLEGDSNFKTGFTLEAAEKETEAATYKPFAYLVKHTYTPDYDMALPETRFYKLVDVDLGSLTATYLRTSVLGQIDKKGNKVIEYDRNEDSLGSLLYKNTKIGNEVVAELYFGIKDNLENSIQIEDEAIVTTDNALVNFDSETEDPFNKPCK